MEKWIIILLCLLSWLFLCVTGTGAAGNKALEEKIVALEKQGWEAIKKTDWTALGSLMAEDFVEVGEMGIRGKLEAIQDLKANLTFTEYAMEEVKVLELNKDADMVTYRLVQKRIVQGTGFAFESQLQRSLCPAWGQVAEHILPANCCQVRPTRHS